MVSLDDMKDLVLYKRPFFLPIDPKNKKLNSAVMLLTPNAKSSINVMTTPYIINKKYFESYYLEKSVYRYISSNNESVEIPEDSGEYLFEVSESMLNDEEEVIEESTKFTEIATVSAIIRDDDGKMLVVYDTNTNTLTIPNIIVKNKELIPALNDMLEKDLGIKNSNVSLAFDMNYTFHVKSKDYLNYDYCYFVNEHKGFVKNLNKNRYKIFKFMTPGDINKESQNKELSKTLRYILARYGKSIVNRTATQYADDKLANNTVIYSGYKADIAEVAEYLKSSTIKNAYDIMEEPLPKYPIHIMCSNSTDDTGYVDDRNAVVYTPKAFIAAGYDMLYTEYIAYTVQLQAIYNYNPKVQLALAEPAALVLSGLMDDILDEEDERGRLSGELMPERVFTYILRMYGVKEVKKILKYNDIKLYAKYGDEASGLGADEEKEENEFAEYYEELANLINEEDEPKAEIPSMEDIGNIGKKIRNKIRSQTVYKLNKIKRDLARGNVGTDSRNTTSLQALKTGSVVSKADIQTANPTTSAPNTESFNFEQLKEYTHGDYIEYYNTIYLFEDNINYDIQLRSALYNDRFRSVKQVLQIYKELKEELPWIKYTYTDLSRYKNKNLFFDLSYYNEAFFRNFAERLNVGERSNTTKMVKIYAELMSRLINDGRLSEYKKKTIFIPVLDWRHNSSTRMWMYKEDINPISIIYDMLLHDVESLKKLFGDHDVVFLGAKNYFKVNFSKVVKGDNSTYIKFLTLIRRIIALGYNSMPDPDPTGDSEHSPKGIAMDLVDKIEKSQNVEINDVSKFDSLNKETKAIQFADKKTVKPIDLTIGTPATKNIIVDDPSKASAEVQTKAAGTTTVDDKKATVVQATMKVTKQDATPGKSDPSVNNSVNVTDDEAKKQAVVDKIASVANDATDPDDAMDKLDNDEFKEMILSLNTETEDNVKIDKARASKMAKIEDQFHNSQVAGKSVKDLLKENPNDKKLPVSKLPVSSINEDWSNMSFMNFDKEYDPDADIIKMLDSMKNWSYPVMVSEVNVTDNSTSEDVLDKWEIKCEDYRGTKFKLVLDVPRFVEGNFLKLRGNEKVIMIQSTQIPIIKTDLETCQIIGIGGYNKIMIHRYGGRAGKSIPTSDRLLKAINKYRTMAPTAMKVVYGDNHVICDKYELPMDYIDIANVLNTVDTKDYKFYFNQDELRLEYQVDDSKGIPIGIKKNTVIKEAKTEVSDSIVYYNEQEMKKYDVNTLTGYIGALLCVANEDFSKVYSSIALSNTEYTYSRANISSTKIPVIIILAYLEGLIPILKKARINYEFTQKLDKNLRYSTKYDYIKFLDGYLVYEVNYSSSLLLNGLKRHDTENYSIKEINSKPMYLDFLDDYGGTLKADGLENSYDCMLDPITKELLEIYKLPTDYAGVLLHANNLLADNKFISHTDQSVRRWRRKELLAGYFYKAISTSYQSYANSIRHSRKIAKMTVKQSAIIDLILSKDPSTSDLSVNNVINDVECTHTVTNKGLVGLNVDRAYSVDKRNYDDSMLNVFGMDTGFSGNVGINRQATMDANIEGNRGIVKTINGDPKKLSVAKSLTATEGMVPLGSTHDDPPRTLMTYVQTSKHMVRCVQNDPLLVTNGTDQALPYLASDIFSFKAKKDGTVTELNITDELNNRGSYMVVEYKDGTHEFIDLSEQIKKNSDGGYYIPLQLKTDLHVGSKVKAGAVLAYDKDSFVKDAGESKNLTATSGTLAKIAVLNTDEGFEDSAMITSEFGEKLGTVLIMPEEIVLDKNANIVLYKHIGDHVMEGETIMAYTSGYEDDEVANALMKNFNFSQDQISELGRTPVTTEHTGILTDIEVYRTVDLDELSPSLRSFVQEYEKNIKKTKAVYNKYNIDTAMLPPTTKVEQVGKAKNVTNGVKILFHIKYTDTMSIGDKIVFYSANKGVVKYIVPKGEEPYTDFRRNEHVDSFMSISSINQRMTFSIPIMCGLNKAMVELDRTIKDIAGIKYDDTKV